jgi:regulator of RNase E activity RraA
MKIANVKGMVAKLMLTGLAAGAFMAASPATAQAQQFAVGVQFGHPAYIVDHGDYRYADRDGYRVDRDDYRYADHDGYRVNRDEEFREREAREEFARRQAFFQHEQWERAHRYDRPYGYR